MLLKYFSSPVKNGQFVMFLSGSEDLTQHCLNLSTYKSTLFQSTQVCAQFVLIVASLTVARYFRRILLLGSLQNTILLLCTHAQKRARCTVPHVHERYLPMGTRPAHIQYHECEHAMFTFLKKTDPS